MRELRLETALARAQLDALQLEIQPHFLFNTLNSIAALIRARDNAQALEMLLNLSELMRSTLGRPPDQLRPLAEELEFVKRYVALQQTRFADRLTVLYDVDDRCLPYRVPVFLLQPLVENAIRHGARRAAHCRIEISASCPTLSQLHLSVTDDGTGLPDGFDAVRDAGTGLSNTRSRLTQLYGDAARFTITRNDPAGTIVDIAIPTGQAALVASGS